MTPPEEVKTKLRALLTKYMVTEAGRGRILAAIVTPTRHALDSHLHRGPSRRPLAGWLAKIEAIKSRCTGDEKYDHVALSCVVSDARVEVGEAKPWSVDQEMADWLRSGCPGGVS